MKQTNRIILLVVSASIFVEALDIAIVNLAVPLIQKDFNLANDSLHWIQTLYVLFYGGFLILGGKLSDTIGRRNVFILGSSLFLITSAGAGLANGFYPLLVFRSIQGLAAAMLMPSAFSIVTNTFRDPHERNTALGIFGSFAAIGSGSGLSVGGLIASTFGWQWIFFINVPLIAITIILAYRYVPKDDSSNGRAIPDVLSSAMLTTGIIIITYVIHELHSVKENLMQIAGSAAVVVLCGFGFYKRNQLPRARIIDFSVYKHRLTVTANIAIIAMGAYFSGFLFLISLILQQRLTFSPAIAGLILLPFSVLSALSSRYFIPGMMKRVDTIVVALIGMGLFFIGGLSLGLALYFDNNMLLVLLSIACTTGTGIAVCFSSLMVMAIRELPEEQHGLASSISQSSFFFGSGIGLSIIGLILGFAGSTDNLIPAVVAMSVFAGFGIMVLALSKVRT